MKKTIWIKGAYGPHNLGDDLLYSLIYKNIKNRLDDSYNIVVGVDDKKKARNINGDIEYKSSSQRIKSDFLILGGGGQFYSFNDSEYKFSNKLKYYLTSLFGGKIHHLIYRKLNGDNVIKKAAFCVGVGPFHNPSYEINAVKKIAGFDYFSVRDMNSYNLLESNNIEVSKFTDPVFVLEPIKAKSSGDKIGIILRDWNKDEYGKNVIEKLKDLARELKNKNYNVEILLLSNNDTEIIDSRLKGIPVWTWNADEDPEITVKKWNEKYNTIISSRAHGVLLGALAGCNVIVAPLERKLKNFHLFFPKSTHYIKAEDFKEKNVFNIEYYINSSFDFDKRSEEIIYNRSIAVKAFDSLCDWIKNNHD
ncbi:polysaccharide pyruvyl transferase family protein [Photobacterium sp. GSS17]|uniref:polysaccharide pyruvyl transferase family protein n=1 Tax=Photobacterium sp. GSS17 TaxID=3020715 RepID=UPI00235FA6A7|nr:polysaccharide pyruvyl transferase family protein [Photobacterium sp. GSS17]